ncbi:MAG TPA: alkyl sulfatase dimerization domain-containing protein, partial [Amphiplicatus sp.]|nr:alkyl sulfatase dimerization domain-containing protein [Amphiplicatus sp.]
AEAPAEPAFELPPPGEATDATRIANEEFGAGLPLADPGDFQDARKGFLASIEGGIIKDEAGNVVWDQSRFSFLDQPAPPTANPSLWRQAQLNAIHGLFEVTDGVYQLRGYDLAVMTLIRGQTGWIVVDPLLTKETSKAAFALAMERLGDAPIKAVLFTHSHSDHFGGVRGIISDEDLTSGKVRLIAPDGFADAAISENVLAGNYMARRAIFQFGNDLPASPAGVIDSGIGKTLSTGAIGFMAPTETVKETGETLTIDGVDFVFINAPNTEAPAEFMFYLPQKKALCTAELATSTMHNILTLRGAKVRDALSWSKHIDEALEMFGGDAEVVFASHTWPKWGNEKIHTYLEHQRDLYRYIHDQTLRLANQGETLHEIAADVPEASFMRQDFSTRGYYGTLNHNVKATYQRYFGWWDGNPANLNPYPPVEQAKRYVKLAGGADNMIANAIDAYKEGDYRWVATVMNDLVFAEPENQKAKDILASAYEQLGFQSESSIWRNYYLSGAKELRDGVSKRDITQLASPDFVKAIPTPEFFDAMAVRVNPAKAGSGMTINFVFTDTNEKIGVRIENGVAVQRPGGAFDKPAATVKMTRASLNEITLGRATFQGKLAKGEIGVEGNPVAFGQFLLAHDQYDPSFNIVTP